MDTNYLFRVEGCDLQPVEMLEVEPILGIFQATAEERNLLVATRASERLLQRLPKDVTRTVNIALWQSSGNPIGLYRVKFVGGRPLISRFPEEALETIIPPQTEGMGSWTGYLTNLADLHFEAEQAKIKCKAATETIKELQSVNKELARRLFLDQTYGLVPSEKVVPMDGFRNQRKSAL